MTPIAAQMGYYAAAAQVIPVLMLVLFLGESRFFRADRHDSSFALLISLFAMFVLVAGELAALRVLSQGEETGIFWALTTAGLLYGLSFVFSSAVGSLLLEDMSKVSKKRREGLRRLNFVVGMASVVLIGIILVRPF